MDNLIRVIIPALNEESSIGKVINDIPSELVYETIVVDNNSVDKTSEVAKSNGATVLKETEPGYGAACLKGMDYITNLDEPTDIIVFLDGDYSDFPEEMTTLVAPIIEQDYDLVIGSRVLGVRERGSLTPVQLFGNWLSTKLIN